MATENLAETIAARIIRQRSLTAYAMQTQHNKRKVRRSVRNDISRRSPYALSKIVWSSPCPVDITGLDHSNGHSFMRAAAIKVVMNEIGRQLNMSALQELSLPPRPIPPVRMARAS